MSKQETKICKSEDCHNVIKNNKSICNKSKISDACKLKIPKCLKSTLGLTRRVFDCNSIFTIPKNAKYKTVIAELWGGGGGGGAGTAVFNASAGAFNFSTGGIGGGGGGYLNATISVKPGQKFIVIIGDGGSAGNSATHVTSGVSSTVTTPGGNGGNTQLISPCSKLNLQVSGGIGGGNSLNEIQSNGNGGTTIEASRGFINSLDIINGEDGNYGSGFVDFVGVAISSGGKGGDSGRGGAGGRGANAVNNHNITIGTSTPVLLASGVGKNPGGGGGGGSLFSDISNSGSVAIGQPSNGASGRVVITYPQEPI